MGASRIVAVRQALTAAVGALDAFQGIEVMYAYKVTAQRTFAYTRQARFTHDPAAMKSGRNNRKETGRFEFVIWVEDVGGSPEDAAEKALDLGLAFEEYVADHKGSLVPDQYAIQVKGDGELGEAINDRASYAELVYPVEYQARLT